MVLQNSYIFLYKDKTEKEKYQKKDDNSIILNIPCSVKYYIKKTFNLTKTTEILHFYQYEYETVINLNGLDFQVRFRTFEVLESTYLDVQVTGKTKHQIVLCLEHIHNTLLSSGVEKEYIPIISYDAVSEYYCNKLYPKLNGLERNLRKLLFNTYIVNFGKSYYERTINKSIQGKAKQVIRARGNKETKKEKNLQEFFYSLEFGDIQEILFTLTWTDYDQEKKRAFLESNKDLSELTDEKLRTAFSDFSAKNDWERFFKDKTNNSFDIESAIDSIRAYRNDVAHCKFVSNEEYNTCNKLIEMLNKEIITAIKITEEKDFMDKNMESLKRSFLKISESLMSFKKTIESAISPLVEKIQKIIQPFESVKKQLSQLTYNNYYSENSKEPIISDDKEVSKNKDESEKNGSDTVPT